MSACVAVLKLSGLLASPWMGLRSTIIPYASAAWPSLPCRTPFGGTNDAPFLSSDWPQLSGYFSEYEAPAYSANLPDGAGGGPLFAAATIGPIFFGVGNASTSRLIASNSAESRLPFGGGPPNLSISWFTRSTRLPGFGWSDKNCGGFSPAVSACRFSKNCAMARGS